MLKHIGTLCKMHYIIYYYMYVYVIYLQMGQA